MAPKSRPALHNQENFLPKPQLILVSAVLGVIQSVTLIDSNGISTALPAIAAGLHGEQTISWAGSSSLIATTAAGLLYGRLSDIFGRTTMFVGALIVFTAAELCCSFAVNPPMFYVFRAFTGASGGAIGNLVLIIGADVLPLRQRASYYGVMGVFIALGNMVGPFLSAAFAYNTTWRAFFWFLTPLGLIGAIVAAWTLPVTKPTDSFWANLLKIDWLGSVTSTVAIALILIPVSGGGSYYAWDSPLVISMLAVGGACFLAFLLIEWKLAPLPIIPLQMFKTRDVIFLSLQTFAISWINQTNLYFLPLYFQNLRGWSPLVSAAMLLPIVSVQSFVSALAGRWITKKGAYGGVIRLGTALLLIGSCLQIILNDSINPAGIVFILLVVGTGFGSASQPIIIAMLAHTKNSDRAVITSSRLFFRSIGAAVGVAVSSAVLQADFKRALPAEYKDVSSSIYSLTSLSPEARRAAKPAYAEAIRDVFITNAALSVVGALCCFGWRDVGYENRPKDDQEVTPDDQPHGDNKSGEQSTELVTMPDNIEAGEHRQIDNGNGENASATNRRREQNVERTNSDKNLD